MPYTIAVVSITKTDINITKTGNCITLRDIKSLSTREPDRRDTCHLTDFSQTFTDD